MSRYHFTQDQIAALSTLDDAANKNKALSWAWSVIHPLLPDGTTNPQPVLPTEPGHYSDSDGQGWQLQANGGWTEVGVPDPMTAADARRFAPFTRLVPERPQVTRGQVVGVMNQHHKTVGEQVDSLLDLFYGIRP